MTNLIKKYWFVSLVVIFLFVIIIYFVYDTNKDTLSGKKVDGNDVVYTINKIDKTYLEEVVGMLGLKVLLFLHYFYYLNFL